MSIAEKPFITEADASQDPSPAEGAVSLSEGRLREPEVGSIKVGKLSLVETASIHEIRQPPERELSQEQEDDLRTRVEERLAVLDTKYGTEVPVGATVLGTLRDRGIITEEEEELAKERGVTGIEVAAAAALTLKFAVDGVAIKKGEAWDIIKEETQAFYAAKKRKNSKDKKNKS